MAIATWSEKYKSTISIVEVSKQIFRMYNWVWTTDEQSLLVYIYFMTNWGYIYAKNNYFVKD